MFLRLWKELMPALGRFRDDRRGSVFATISVAIVPLVAMIGLSTDAGRGYMIKARLGQAVDAAALAGGRVFFESYREDEVQKYFDANFPPGYLDSTPNPVPLQISFDNTTGEIEVEATVSVPTTFLRVLSLDHMTVSSRAVVQRELHGLELAMVLDVTGSMAGSKLTSLKLAANALLDVLYGEGNNLQENLWVSLVPFAARVNVAPNTSWLNSLWQTTPPATWSGCMNPRTGSNAFDDTPPGDSYPSSERFPGYLPLSTPPGGRPPTTYGCPSSDSSDTSDLSRNQVLPLTAERDVASDAIDAMVAYSNTRTDVGMVWGGARSRRNGAATGRPRIRPCRSTTTSR